ncbi:YibE/F family protein [Gryllotalpicola daejeonensis]|uniref:YibE/F family protein n=1 Tax=Gryllotalpicola daejeonensis TaxID=993087 RepID=A0ABP7ZE96_9MICO
MHWWPDANRVDSVRNLVPFAVSGTKVVHGEVLEVVPSCTGKETSPDLCGDSPVHISDGPHAGTTVKVALTPDVIATGIQPGDHILLLDTSGATNGPTQPLAFYRYDRGSAMLWFAILFGVAVVLVAWRRGVMALVSLGFAGVAVIAFLVPALLSGEPAVPVALAASVAILIAMLYLTHGFSMRTSVALTGALVGLGLSTLFAWLAVTGWRLADLGDESAGLLANNVPWVNVQQLVIASVVLAGLGTLNDVTVTQASALWELRAASPTMTRWQLFWRAMRIGRDHVASTVYTLVFAYLGTALILIVAVQLYGGTARDFVTAEDVAEEIVRALVGGLALVLAMPVTTAIGALVVAEPEPTRRTADDGAGDGRGARQPGRPSEAAPVAPPVTIAVSPTKDDLLRLPENPWDGD